MPGNTIGHLFRLTTFGESHGHALGGVIDGCPPGLTVDMDFIREELHRRNIDYQGSTARKEEDKVEFLSGILDGKSLGTPIGFTIRNLDGKSSDYNKISNLYRPSHADFTYFQKYGITAPGGGRASGRETAARVAGGAIAKLFLNTAGIEIRAFVSQIGDAISDAALSSEHLLFALNSPFGCPDKAFEDKVAGLIREAVRKGDTLGGTVSCIIKGIPAGIGEPVFDKLNACLAGAMLSIGTAKAFEYGLGFRATSMKGSEYNDQMSAKDGKVVFLTNHDGGIQGGISNGEDIYFRVGFKPVPSVKIPQSTIGRNLEPAEITIGGRHDACHVPRLVVVVEAMAALVVADHWLRARVGNPL
jgi:chorismate synthase